MNGETEDKIFSIETAIQAPAIGGTEAILVEDDEATRHALSRHLNERGFSVRVASDGFAALADIADRIPVVTIIRHGLGGPDTFDRMLALAVMLYPRSRIILTSSRADQISDCPYPVLSLPLDTNRFDRMLEETGCLTAARITPQ